MIISCRRQRLLRPRALRALRRSIAADSCPITTLPSTMLIRPRAFNGSAPAAFLPCHLAPLNLNHPDPQQQQQQLHVLIWPRASPILNAEQLHVLPYPACVSRRRVHFCAAPALVRAAATPRAACNSARHWYFRVPPAFPRAACVCVCHLLFRTPLVLLRAARASVRRLRFPAYTSARRLPFRALPACPRVTCTSARCLRFRAQGVLRCKCAACIHTLPSAMFIRPQASHAFEHWTSADRCRTIALLFASARRMPPNRCQPLRILAAKAHLLTMHFSNAICTNVGCICLKIFGFCHSKQRWVRVSPNGIFKHLRCIILVMKHQVL